MVFSGVRFDQITVNVFGQMCLKKHGVDPDLMPQNMASNKGLYCLPCSKREWNLLHMRAQHAIWSGPSLYGYKIFGYCNVEMYQVALH